MCSFEMSVVNMAIAESFWWHWLEMCHAFIAAIMSEWLRARNNPAKQRVITHSLLTITVIEAASTSLFVFSAD